jgi:plastocyanin
MHEALRFTRLAGLVALAVLAALGVAYPSSAGAVQATQAVRIIDFAFEPAALTVAPGTRVTWTHAGQAPHTVTSDTGAFDSGRLTGGQTFAFTFTSAGTFAYHCEIHPNMRARVVVQAAAPAPAMAGAPRPAALPSTGVTVAAEGAGVGWPAALLAALALAGAAAVRGYRCARRP